jgi:hypothetical protein
MKNDIALIEDEKQSEQDQTLASVLELIVLQKQTAVLQYENTILPVLYQMDRANERVLNELDHCPHQVLGMFKNASSELKRLIYEIERREENHEKTD